MHTNLNDLKTVRLYPADHVLCNVVPITSKHLTNGFCFSAGFHSNSPYRLEEEEADVEVQEDFLSFESDLVAEQLTYMDAVSASRANQDGAVAPLLRNEMFTFRNASTGK